MKYSLKTLLEKKGFVAFAIFTIFIIAFFMRVMYLPQGALTFAYDQARDALIIQEILDGDFKILGPSVSGIPGFYHGVLYYYVIAPAYLLGNGCPVVVSFWLALINSLFVFVVYFLAKKMTGKQGWSLIAALLFALSFEQSQYATWLSNPTMGVWFVTLLYTGLYLWLKERKTRFLLLSGLSYGFAIQSNFSLTYHLIPIALWFLYSRKSLKKEAFVLFLGAFVFSVFSMVLVELKFGFKIFDGLKYLLDSQQNLGLKTGLGEFIIDYLNHMGRVFANNLFPQIPAFGGLFGTGMLLYYLFRIANLKNKHDLEIKLLITWILSFLMASTLGGTNIPHITAGIGVGVIILTTFFIREFIGDHPLIAIYILLIIFVANIVKIVDENRNGQTIFAIQKDMILVNEKAVVDYTYNHAEGGEFSINTLTSPLYINTTWSYLYNFYGKEKYGYLPFWRGKSQKDLLGDNLPGVEEDVFTHFYIIEDMEGIPSRYLTDGLEEENSKSKVVDKNGFGKLIVQKRQILENK